MIPPCQYQYLPTLFDQAYFITQEQGLEKLNKEVLRQKEDFVGEVDRISMLAKQGASIFEREESRKCIARQDWVLSQFFKIDRTKGFYQGIRMIIRNWFKTTVNVKLMITFEVKQ